VTVEVANEGAPAVAVVAKALVGSDVAMERSRDCPSVVVAERLLERREELEELRDGRRPVVPSSAMLLSKYVGSCFRVPKGKSPKPHIVLFTSA
jgi:hypothetical protein